MLTQPIAVVNHHSQYVEEEEEAKNDNDLASRATWRKRQTCRYMISRHTLHAAENVSNISKHEQRHQ